MQLLKEAEIKTEHHEGGALQIRFPTWWIKQFPIGTKLRVLLSGTGEIIIAKPEEKKVENER